MLVTLTEGHLDVSFQAKVTLGYNSGFVLVKPVGFSHKMKLEVLS